MYSPEQRREIVEYVCEEISKGRSMKSVLGDRDDLPSVRTFDYWEASDEHILASIERAREVGARKLLEEMIEIADDKSEDPSSRKVRIYARETLAAKIAPRRFGTKIDHTTDGEKIQTAQPVLIDARIQSLLMQAEHRAQLPAPDYGDLFD